MTRAISGYPPKRACSIAQQVVLPSLQSTTRQHAPPTFSTSSGTPPFRAPRAGEALSLSTRQATPRPSQARPRRGSTPCDGRRPPPPGGGIASAQRGMRPTGLGGIDNGERRAVSGEEFARDIAANRLDPGVRRGKTGTIAGLDRDVDERPPRGRAPDPRGPTGARRARRDPTETPNESSATPSPSPVAFRYASFRVQQAKNASSRRSGARARSPDSSRGPKKRAARGAQSRSQRTPSTSMPTSCSCATASSTTFPEWATLKRRAAGGSSAGLPRGP